MTRLNCVSLVRFGAYGWRLRDNHFPKRKNMDETFVANNYGIPVAVRT